LEFADRSQLKALAQKIDDKITLLCSFFETGNALKQGIPVAIIGKTMSARVPYSINSFMRIRLLSVILMGLPVMSLRILLRSMD
jgi:hypothetical protein